MRLCKFNKYERYTAWFCWLLLRVLPKVGRHSLLIASPTYIDGRCIGVVAYGRPKGNDKLVSM